METNAISKFNEALRDSVKMKWEELKNSNAKIFHFDIDKVLIESLELDDLDKEVPNDGLEYFWIEYEKDGSLMKFAFFFKDIDNNKPTYNVHVIPGIFEKYSFQPGKNPPQNKPYACVEDGKAVIKNIKHGYPSFAEQDGGGWWVPEKDFIPLKVNEKNRKMELVDTNSIETIPSFEKYFEEFRNFEKTASSNFAAYLNSSIDGLKIGGQKTPTERYMLLGWHNIKDANYSMHLTRPIFFMGYGFFTQYHCINFGKDIGGRKKKGENDIITDYSVVTTLSDYKKFRGLSLSDGTIFSTVKQRFDSFCNEIKSENNK